MARIEVENEQEIIQEAETLLLKKLGPAKATRFWVAFSGRRRLPRYQAN